jgi:hypothetical protein
MAQPTGEFIATPPRGDFLSEKRRNPVHKTEVTYEDETQKALIREHRVQMRDGAYYKFSEVLPKQPQIDVPLIWTPAFTTSHNKGVSKHYALAMADLGVPTFSISPQQNRLRIGNMSRGSHDHIEASMHIAGSLGLDRTHFMAAGPSRGGDQALAMTGVAPAHEAEVVYFDSLAACMARGLFNKDFRKQAAKLKHEPASLMGAIRKGPREYIGVLATTVTYDLGEAYQQAKEVVTLIDGSPGRLAAKMPESSFGVAQQYVNDGLAFHEHWPEVLDQFPNVYQFYDEGSHFHCVDPEEIDKSIERVAHARDGIMSGAVGAAALHDCVAVKNPLFQREVEPHLSVVPAS